MFHELQTVASYVASRVFGKGIDWDAFKSMCDFEHLDHVALLSAVFEGGKVERLNSLCIRMVADVINICWWLSSAPSLWL